LFTLLRFASSTKEEGVWGGVKEGRKNWVTEGGRDWREDIWGPMEVGERRRGEKIGGL